MRKSLICQLLFATPLFLSASSLQPPGSSLLRVLVDGTPRPEYFARGTTYVEAVKGQEYALRITNPYGVRVAVALSVDGLNTIDARHTDARSARKWVLDPYQTIVISGWQTSDRQARRFYFTNEQHSYGAWLGQTENLGVISAAFFRERVPIPIAKEAQPMQDGKARGGAIGGMSGVPAPSNAPRAQSEMKKDDDLAATGIGRGVDHPVTQVWLDLEDSPAATVNIRYEYRAALVSLGVFPPYRDPLTRREQASGFCPSPR